MYYQLDLKTTSRTLFVLNPKGSIGSSSYETVNDTLYILVTNKREVKKECGKFFTECEHTFDRKVGPYNRFEVTLTGLVKYSDSCCVLTAEPPPLETVIRHLIVDQVELTDRSYRSPLLTHYVLGDKHPTQFNKILNSDFMVEEVSSSLRKVTLKPNNFINETKPKEKEPKVKATV